MSAGRSCPASGGEGTILPSGGDFGDGFSVSRSVARETIRVLASMGLVEARQNIGTRVRSRAAWRLLDPDVIGWLSEGFFDEKFLRDLMELREFVEPNAAYHAASRATKAERAHLTATIESMRLTVADPGAFAEADCEFHAVVLRACHNTVLQQLDEALAAALRITRIWITEQASEEFGPTTLASRVTAHSEVADAISRRDRDAAQKAMQRIISQASRDLEHRLRQLRRIDPPSVES